MGSRDAEHPHRCREGHRWQHAGPTALVCEIPVHDSATGDLTLVSEGDCPVCSGREDLLVRELHSHYCNTCEGEWDHEGRCLDGLAASCPWCFLAPDAAPAPGARRGPHFHFCPECAKNWQHDASCAAPLRAAFDPDAGACRWAPSESSRASSRHRHRRRVPRWQPAQIDVRRPGRSREVPAQKSESAPDGRTDEYARSALIVRSAGLLRQITSVPRATVHRTLARRSCSLVNHVRRESHHRVSAAGRDRRNDSPSVTSWLHRIAPRRQTAKMRAPGWGGSSYPVRETLWGAG